MGETNEYRESIKTNKVIDTFFPEWENPSSKSIDYLDLETNELNELVRRMENELSIIKHAINDQELDGE